MGLINAINLQQTNDNVLVAGHILNFNGIIYIYGRLLLSLKQHKWHTVLGFPIHRYGRAQSLHSFHRSMCYVEALLWYTEECTRAHIKISFVHFPLDHAMHIYLRFIYQFQCNIVRRSSRCRSELCIISIDVDIYIYSRWLLYVSYQAIYIFCWCKLPKFLFIWLSIKTCHFHKILVLMLKPDSKNAKNS